MEIDPDFCRRGDYMVTTASLWRMRERLFSTASRACRDGFGLTGYLYWDIELEP